MAYNFDAADIAKVAEHFPGSMPGPSYEEMAAEWPAEDSEMSDYSTVAERILATRRSKKPIAYRVKGDWMTNQGYIDNFNRPSKVEIYCDHDGRWWAVSWGQDPYRVGAYAVGSDAPLLIPVPGPSADIVEVLCMGGFCPDAGELERVGMPVAAV